MAGVDGLLEHDRPEHVDHLGGGHPLGQDRQSHGCGDLVGGLHAAHREVAETRQQLGPQVESCLAGFTSAIGVPVEIADGFGWLDRQRRAR